jgi:hypothetical protein
MGLIERVKAIFSRADAVDAMRAEDVPDPKERPRDEQEGYEGLKDDDAIAGGVGPTGAVLGPETTSDLYDDFQDDQEAPRDPAP